MGKGRHAHSLKELSCKLGIRMRQAPDEEELFRFLTVAVEQAGEAFRASRQKEGEALREDLLGKLAVMAENVSAVEARYPDILKEYEEKLRTRLNEALGDARADEHVIATELVV